MKDKLDVKVGTKREAFLTKILEAMENEASDCQVTVEINNEFIPILKKKIKEEKEKV